MHTPAVLHVPDWQYDDAVPEVQPDWPFTAPHFPFEPHMFDTHWFDAVQAVALAAPQVFVVTLQAAVAQVALAFPPVQTPLCSPSFGMATPAPFFAVHVNVLRAQYCPLAHSPST